MIPNDLIRLGMSGALCLLDPQDGHSPPVLYECKSRNPIGECGCALQTNQAGYVLNKTKVLFETSVLGFVFGLAGSSQIPSMQFRMQPQNDGDQGSQRQSLIHPFQKAIISSGGVWQG